MPLTPTKARAIVGNTNADDRKKLYPAISNPTSEVGTTAMVEGW